MKINSSQAVRPKPSAERPPAGKRLAKASASCTLNAHLLVPTRLLPKEKAYNEERP